MNSSHTSKLMRIKCRIVFLAILTACSLALAAFSFYHSDLISPQWAVPILSLLLAGLSFLYASSSSEQINLMKLQQVAITALQEREVNLHMIEQTTKKAEENLQQNLHKAKSANQSKNDLLAIISHELRTPLNAIIGFNQCLLMGIDGPINQAQKASLKKIERSSFHLLDLLNHFLDLSTIEGHRMKLELIPCNMVEIIDSCIEEVRPMADLKGLAIHFDEHTLPLLLEIDPTRIRQVFLNLLSNAIKFTEEGYVSVSIVEEPGQVVIQIKDTGIGLLPEEIERIFSPYTQAEPSIKKKYGGTGLGLMISKRIIDLHGGAMFVESIKGQGSTFKVSIPVQDSS